MQCQKATGYLRREMYEEEEGKKCEEVVVEAR